jgi:hypothetical protein
MDMTSRQGGGGMFVLLDCSVTGSDFRGVAVKKAKGAGHFVGIDRQNELVTVAGKKSWERSLTACWSSDLVLICESRVTNVWSKDASIMPQKSWE